MEKVTQITLYVRGSRRVWVEKDLCLAPQGPEDHPLEQYFLRDLVIHTHGLVLLRALSSFFFLPFPRILSYPQHHPTSSQRI